MALVFDTTNQNLCSLNSFQQSSSQIYQIFDPKNDVKSNPIARVSNSRKRRRSNHCEIIVESETKRNQAENKYLECLHHRISLLEDLYNDAISQAGQSTPKTLGVGERVFGLEKKMNLINHIFRTNLRDSLGNFCCPRKECDRGYKTAADLHVHIRREPGNGYDILQRIIDQTYCIRCDLHLKRPRDLQRHEKVNHGEAYDSRIELFLGCLTQHVPQIPLVDETRINVVSDALAQDFEALSSQVSQPKTSCTEMCNVLANSTGPQPFTNSHGSQAGGICNTSALTTKYCEDNQSRFSSNKAVTSDPMFPFEMPPLQEPHNGSLMDFPFNLGIDGDHVEDSRANNFSAQHLSFASPTVPFQQTNVVFAEDNNTMIDFVAHDFPFDVFPGEGDLQDSRGIRTRTLPLDKW